MIAQLGPTVEIICRGVAYQVPRHFISGHGYVGYELPALAKEHGWSARIL